MSKDLESSKVPYTVNPIFRKGKPMLIIPWDALKEAVKASLLIKIHRAHPSNVDKTLDPHALEDLIHSINILGITPSREE